MRFSTEQSVALSAALLALPAIAAPIQPQGERQSEVAHAQQPAAAEPATPAVRPTSNDEEATHRVPQIHEVQGGLRVPKTKVGSSREGKSRRPAGESRLREGASSHREGESRLREGASNHREGASSQREGESRHRKGASSHREGESRRPSQGETRPAHLEAPSSSSSHYVEARGSKVDAVVNGVNQANDVGNAVNGLVQTGESIWDSAKSAFKPRGSKVDSVVNGVNKASDIGNAAGNLIQTGENIWDSAKSAFKPRGSKVDAAVNGVNQASDVGNAASNLIQTGESVWDSAKGAWDDVKSS